MIVCLITITNEEKNRVLLYAWGFLSVGVRSTDN
jgi:hypothetical protein